MRIEPHMFANVGYIAEDNGEGSYEPCATCFFVSYLSPGKDYKHGYMVTNRHVIEDLKNANQAFTCVINQRNGGIVTIPEASEKWYFHPTDSAADVAVRPFEVKSEYEVGDLSTDRFLSNDIFASTTDCVVGVGDEVSIMGLFTVAPGQSRQVPLVRHGNIAMIPNEKLWTGRGEAEVYLIEARSIGGLSGSPVLVQETFHAEGSDPDIFVSGGKIYLLGMIQAHWDINERDINKTQTISDYKRGVNMGIATVVPARKIHETLEDDVLAMMRKQVEDGHCNKFKPTGD